MKILLAFLSVFGLYLMFTGIGESVSDLDSILSPVYIILKPNMGFERGLINLGK